MSLLLVLTCAAPAVVVSQPVAAVNVFSKTCPNGNKTPISVCQSIKSSSKNPIIGGLKVAINIVSVIIGVAAIIVIIISGLSMITSSGDPQEVGKARNGIIFSLVGIIVAALAQVLVALVLNRL